MMVEPCQLACKQILIAGEKGFNHFKIQYRDAKLEVQGTGLDLDLNVESTVLGYTILERGTLAGTLIGEQSILAGFGRSLFLERQGGTSQIALKNSSGD